MRIGELRHRVRIQRQAGAADGYGGRADAWEDVCTIWARVRALSGREGSERDGEMVESESSYEVLVRERGDLASQQRLLWGSRTMMILAVLPERPGRLRLICREVN